MPAPSLDAILKHFDRPDEVRTFTKGRLELVTLGGLTIGRATYEPGWKWSEHVGPAVGAARRGAVRCTVEHVRCTSWARPSTRRSNAGGRLTGPATMSRLPWR
jgi:hypothetical protein